MLQAPRVAPEKELIIDCKFVTSRVFNLKLSFKAWSNRIEVDVIVWKLVLSLGISSGLGRLR